MLFKIGVLKTFVIFTKKHMCWRVTRGKNWETFSVSVHYRKNVDLNDNELTLSGRWESECLDD